MNDLVSPDWPPIAIERLAVPEYQDSFRPLIDIDRVDRDWFDHACDPTVIPPLDITNEALIETSLRAIEEGEDFLIAPEDGSAEEIGWYWEEPDWDYSALEEFFRRPSRSHTSNPYGYYDGPWDSDPDWPAFRVTANDYIASHFSGELILDGRHLELETYSPIRNSAISEQRQKRILEWLCIEPQAQKLPGNIGVRLPCRAYVRLTEGDILPLPKMLVREGIHDGAIVDPYYVFHERNIDDRDAGILVVQLARTGDLSVAPCKLDGGVSPSLYFGLSAGRRYELHCNVCAKAHRHLVLYSVLRSVSDRAFVDATPVSQDRACHSYEIVTCMHCGNVSFRHQVAAGNGSELGAEPYVRCYPHMQLPPVDAHIVPEHLSSSDDLKKAGAPRNIVALHMRITEAYRSSQNVECALTIQELLEAIYENFAVDWNSGSIQPRPRSRSERRSMIIGFLFLHEWIDHASCEWLLNHPLLGMPERWEAPPDTASLRKLMDFMETLLARIYPFF